MRIVILSFGTRGNVQPYLALALGLQAAGHEVVLAAPKNFSGFVTKAGIQCFPMDTDVLSLVRAETGRLLINASLLSRVRLYRRMFPQIVEEMSNECWQAAQSAEAIIYDAPVVAGPHIAEKLGVPAFIATHLPTIRPTDRYPHPSFVQRLPVGLSLGGVLNKLTYSFVRPFVTFPDPYSFLPLQNEFRERTLGLPPQPREATPLEIRGKPIPLLYNFSPHVIRPAEDWSNTTVTGYWFLPRQDDWQPPPDLEEFLGSGPPPVYVGFGSMTSDRPHEVAKTVISALKNSGQRGIIDPAWGAMEPEVDGDSVFWIKDPPHEWLFPRVSAVVHHGGPGTMMMALRYGKPNVVCPFSFDHAYWGKLVEGLGVGSRSIPQRKLSEESLAEAIRRVVTDAKIRERAVDLGAKIRAEDGVGRAVEHVEKVIRAHS